VGVMGVVQQVERGHLGDLAKYGCASLPRGLCQPALVIWIPTQ